MKFLASPLLLALLAKSVSANKDDTYYAGGIESPNIESKMYWSGGTNVLADLNQFDALYVTYHNCAWETPTGDDENEGGGGGDGDDWYVGSVPSFRANAAFSLYGQLKGGPSGCSKKTFINSFHTTQGLESFTNAMASAGLTNLFAYDDGEENDDWKSGTMTSNCFQDEDEDNDGDDYYYNGDKMSGGAISYGLGCTADKNREFAIHSYLGGYCDANAINSTLDDLEDLNERLDLAKCVPIYASGDSYSADDDESSSPLAILETSRTCRVHDGTGSCPDPYKRLKMYEKNLLRATGAIANVTWVNQYRLAVISYTMCVMGGILVMAAIAIASMECGGGEKKSKKKKKKRSWKKRMSGKKEKKDKKKKDKSDPHGISAKSSSYGDDMTESSEVAGTARDGTKDGNYTQPVITVADVVAKEESEHADADYIPKTDVGTPDHGEEMAIRRRDSEEASIASQSVQAINDIVHFVKTKADEVFNEEADEDAEEGEEGMPYNSPSKANDETEVDSQGEDTNKKWSNEEEAASKKRDRKKRWFNKLLTGSKKGGPPTGDVV